MVWSISFGKRKRQLCRTALHNRCNCVTSVSSEKIGSFRCRVWLTDSWRGVVRAEMCWRKQAVWLFPDLSGPDLTSCGVSFWATWHVGWHLTVKFRHHVQYTQTHTDTHSIYSEICFLLMRRCEQTQVKATASWTERLEGNVLVGTFSTFYLLAAKYRNTHTTSRLFQVSLQLASLVWNWIEMTIQVKLK